MLKKITAAVICAALAAVTLCGCDNGEKDDFPTEMYYGQAVKEVNRKDIYLIYDGRYVSDEEMNVLADYYIAIQEKDYDKFKATQPGEYLDFLAEKNGMDIETVVNREYSSVVSEVGEDFDFTQIDVTDCGNSSRDSGINDVLETIDGIYSDMGKDKKFSETVNDSKYVTFDLYAARSGEEYSLQSQTKYIFNCDDGIYIF